MLNRCLSEAFLKWQANAAGKPQTLTPRPCFTNPLGLLVMLVNNDPELETKMLNADNPYSVKVRPCLIWQANAAGLHCSWFVLHLSQSLPCLSTCSTTVKSLLAGTPALSVLEAVSAVNCVAPATLADMPVPSRMDRETARREGDGEGYHAMAQPDALARVRHLAPALEQAAAHVAHSLQVDRACPCLLVSPQVDRDLGSPFQMVATGSKE